MTPLKKLGVLVLALGAVLVGSSPSRRARLARKLTQARQLVSRRIADRGPRNRAALERWDNEGGAKEGVADAAFR